jgi:hypothetical protein
MPRGCWISWERFDKLECPGSSFMSSRPATLEGYIRTLRLQLVSRSEVEWWGLIILKDSTFEFHLVLFEPDDLDSNDGKSSLFGWHENGNLGLRRSVHTNKPRLEADGLKITVPGHTNLFVGGLPFKQISATMIEAFLDDWHRSKILTTLNNDDQRRKVLPWLQANGLPVYRQLEKAGRRTLEEAVFPPALDFFEEPGVQRKG